MKVNWHLRYQQQSLWTKALRQYLLNKVTIQPTSRVLEVGCGTGVICSDILESYPCQMYGIDINIHSINIATRNTPELILTCGDASLLPFPADFFDIVFCHYFLLWLPDPSRVLQEIKRVLRTGGIFLVFAEPDHTARIDSPSALELIGELQVKSLQNQGVDVKMGRKLPGLLSQAGFQKIQYGVSGFEFLCGTLPDWWSSEWDVIRDDLGSMIDQERLNELMRLDKLSWESGSRILWVPTFYAASEK